MAGRLALGGMAQAVAQAGEMLDLAVQLFSLLFEHRARDFGVIPVQQRADFVQAEAGRAAHGNQRQTLQHLGLVQASQTAPSGRGDEAAFLVITQGRRRQAAGGRDRTDI